MTTRYRFDKLYMRNVKRQYKAHRKLVNKAKSVIDVGPPVINAKIVLKPDEIKTRYNDMKQMIQENSFLIQKFNRIRRDNALSDTFNKNLNCVNSKLPIILERIGTIERENIFMACRLLQVKSEVKTNLKGLIHHKHGIQRYPIGQEVINTYKPLAAETHDIVLNALLRPKVYMDLEVKNLHPLGRIIIQLFTEACPQVVLELVRICNDNNLESLNFMRIFPETWIEGEFSYADRRLQKPGFTFDDKILPHDKGAGILSFAKRYADNGFPQRKINFSISFKRFTVLNGERVGFGIICNNVRSLSCLRDFGTKNGKTKKDIVVKECGVISANIV